ncbi:MAG: amidase enhancer, partial [Cyanobacteriota bacterium]
TFKTTIYLGIFLFGSLGDWQSAIGRPPRSAIAAEPKSQDIELEIGIIQRLGAAPIIEGDPEIKQVTVQSTVGDSLQVSFPGQAKAAPIKTQKVVLKIDSARLPQPKLAEKLILSDRSTFETAEDSANFWKRLGIEVEVAQPGRWQVWAKRDVYQTPLVRRWLLHSLQANGYEDPYLDTQVRYQEPDIVLEIEGRKYNQDQVEITSGKNLVKVNTTSQPQEAKVYGGSLRLQPNAHGEFTLVNQVPLETYLRGVVPYEIGKNAPPQAVAAQSIIARTYALRNLRRFEVDDYQLCATVHCQVYYGLKDTNQVSDRAIAKTAGLVLTYDNELIDALYSSTTGGVTASFADTWNGAERPYLKPVIDAPKPLWNLGKYPLDNEPAFRSFIGLTKGFNEADQTEVFRWNKTRSIADLNQDLQKYLSKTHHPLAAFKTIESMKVQQRSPSGRILELKIQTDIGQLQLHKNEIRSALEPPRSTFFYLEPIYNNLTKQLNGYRFIGGGFGHGVGLSQYGSYNLAKLGWSAEKILAFYYPQTTLKPLDDTIVFWQEDQEDSTSISKYLQSEQ